MHRSLGAVFVGIVALASAALQASPIAGVVGVFQGRIVRPAGVKLEEGILYIRARNGMARKVRVAAAVVEFDEDVPKSQRGKAPAKSLCEETLVRVTAEQSDQEDGAWEAINILILADPEGRPKTKARLKQASFAPEGEPAQGKSASPKGKAEAPGFCAP